MKACISYTNSRGLKPFNWKLFLSRKARYSESTWANAKSLSSRWVTCACGTQCKIIPRTNGDAPDDNELFGLGVGFAFAIHDRDKKKALKILRLIESRSAYLIAQIKRKKRKLS